MSEPANTQEQVRTTSPEVEGEELSSGGGRTMTREVTVEASRIAPANAAAAAPPTTVDIQASVGTGGTNRVSDVRMVQARLRELGLLTANELLSFDVRNNTDVVSNDDMARINRAITLFQRMLNPTGNPDGLVSPNGGTETQLNSSTRTPQQAQRATAAMVNHDTLDGVSIRIIQNVLGGLVDGNLLQDHTGAGTHTNESALPAGQVSTQTRIQNFQANPTGYDGQPVANAPANADRSGYIEESTVAQVFSILVGANQHDYALYLVIDYYEDFVDAPNTAPANQRKLSLGAALEVYYDATLQQASQAYNETAGLRTIAIGPTAFTNAATCRAAVATGMSANPVAHALPQGQQATPLVNPDNLTQTQSAAVTTALTADQRTDAISSNQGLFTQGNSVRVIQDIVGAPVTGAFDAATIERIALYQSAHNVGQPATGGAAALTSNGQLDPRTVDLIGRDLIARQQHAAAIQFAMDYFNINVTTRENIDFGNPENPEGDVTEVRGANLSTIRYDPTLAEAYSTDRTLNPTSPNARIRDVRGIGGARVGVAAFTSFLALVNALSLVISDINRPGSGQVTTEGSTRGLITPLADMSTFQVPWVTDWRTNGGSGWPGASRAPRGNRVHGGWDIYAPTGTPIRATVDGVADVSTQGDYGTVVRLFANGRVYFYAHLSGTAITAPAGRPIAVTQGQVLGYVGTTGNGVPQRPHLHFEVRSGTSTAASTKLDPSDFYTRPTKQRFYSTAHQNMIVTEITTDNVSAYPGVPQTGGN
jgi:murein DD-endopeptidase MepM/ murein hydrolase activator NlpD